MRFRTLLIIVLILAAATPAVLGWALRAQVREALVEAGVPAERIISVAGWRSSRLVFPVPHQTGMEADVILYHGPYLGAEKGWGWAAADIDLLHSDASMAQLGLRITGLARLEGTFDARPALRDRLPQLQWQSLQAQFTGLLLDQHWRGSLTASGLSGANWELAQGQVDWNWQRQPQPNLNLWLQGQHLALSNSSAETLAIEHWQTNADWLEQGSTGSWRSQTSLDGIQAANAQLDGAQLAWQASPLDSTTVHQLPRLLPQLLQHPESLPLQLAPLLALRPQVTIDQIVAKGADEAVHISGSAQLRPGGVMIRTRGGGAETVYLQAIQIIQSLQPVDATLSRREQAEQTLKIIRRQGWLQRRGDVLRADIVINY